MVYTFSELGWFFLAYSFAGWILGVVAESIRLKKFVNTGVLNLPVCPVFGFSAVASSVLLYELKNSPFFLFLGGVIITAFFVRLTDTVLEHIFHRKWRDYKEFRLGFGGAITLPVLLLGGGGTLFVLFAGNPLMIRTLSFLPRIPADVCEGILFLLLAFDLSGTLAVVWGWRRYMNRVSSLTGNMQSLSTNFGNVIARWIRRRLERSYPNIETEKMLAEKEEAPERPKKFAEGCCFYKLLWIFVIGSLLGDLVETVFCRITLGSWMSRSSLVYGPFAIMWGTFGVILTAFLYRHRDKSDRYIFVYGTVVGGAFEYICSVLTELLFGTRFWSYKGIPFNLGGRINLLYCFFWGIASVIWLKILYPRFSDLIEKIPIRIGKIITWILIPFLVADMALSAAALSRYSQRANGIAAANTVEEFLDVHFNDERMKQIYPKSKILKKE